ncbi:MAG: DegQ family serine endoprotease [Alphaproteobacteria bacterium]|nr:DegQ family serine endoprotease [Alphaproteobacteria bacterium]
MKTLRFFMLSSIVCASLLALPLMPSTALAKGLPPAQHGGFADIVEDLIPAVVNISSTHNFDQAQDYPELPQFPEGSPFQDFFEEFMERRQGMPFEPQASLGSGFVIDAENGYIITNNHVVRDADEVRVTFHDDETLTAEVIGTDEKTDLAVLKVETDKELTQVEFGESSVLRVGDWVVAIGNPFGLGGTVTAGIISARQRDINAGPYDDFLQTDASINRGNSGGPMFDMHGKVIGINTAIFSPSGGSVGIGFAIPSELAAPVIEQIIKFGRTRRGWLGVRIQSVTDEIAESLGLDSPHGALVASVTPEGPAEVAQLKAGDIIMEVNDQPIDEMRALPRIVAGLPIGSTAKVKYWREGKMDIADVKIGELEKAEEEGLLTAGSEIGDGGLKIDNVGVSVKELTKSLRDEFGIGPSVNGVIISNIQPRSEAARKGLSIGDVIVEINQQEVSDPQEVADIIKNAAGNGRPSVLLLINREGEVRFLALKLQ